MAKVRARKDNKLLFMDFYYRGVRCREQTALLDTMENRRRVQTLMNRIEKEIKQGSFDYATTFPGSAKAAQFGAVLDGQGNPANISRSNNSASSTASMADTPTFAEFSVTWRAEMAPQWRRQHRDSVDVTFDAHLLPAFGKRLLSEITKADGLTFRAALAERPGRSREKMSASTINKIMTILRQCMTEASERYHLPDAMKGIKRLKARRPDIFPFSLVEANRIIDNIRADYRNYATVRFFTGMRSGEVNGLKWKYVDFEKNLILVRETYSAGEVEDQAKTEQSLRDIPMLPMVKEALLALWENRHPDSEFVFCSREGNPIDAHNFANRVWYPLLRFLEIDKRRPYQTRHTTATLMLASGENPEWIAKLMGHANTQMLFTVYSRFVPNLTRQDGLAITGLLNSRDTKPKTVDEDALNQLDAEQLRALLRQAGVIPPGGNAAAKGTRVASPADQARPRV
ncbi:MAG: DUF3596 domain-containing protein [Pseudoxanthomonas sp.]